MEMVADGLVIGWVLLTVESPIFIGVRVGHPSLSCVPRILSGSSQEQIQTLLGLSSRFG